METLKGIRGSVRADGTILSEGKYFKVVHGETGIYNIIFNEDFSTRPTVVVTQHYPDKDDFNNDGGDTKDNAVIIAIGKDRFKLKTGDNNGHVCDRAFEFIAVE